MTILDLIYEFEVLYDLGSLGLPGIEDEEIKLLLDTEQYAIISQRLQGNNVYGTKYPDTNKRIDDLQGLMVLDNSSTGNITLGGTTSGLNYRTITLPSDYLHLIELRAVYVDGTERTCRQIKLSERIRFESSERNQSGYIKEPVYAFTASTDGSRKLNLYFDPVDEADTKYITSVLCIYIKKPTNLKTIGDAIALVDFNDDVYHELVKKTVDSATAIASPQNVQVSQNQINKSE